MEGNHIIPENIFFDMELNTFVQNVIYNTQKKIHQRNYSILNQELSISIIPIRKMKCASGSDEFNVIICDSDRRVICDDFPTIFDCFKKIFRK